jgi:hypothetical protein
MAERFKETDRFEAFDSEGKAYTVVEYMELIDSPRSVTRGMRRYRTPDGKKVTRIDGSNFEIQDYKPIRVRRDPGL